MLYAFCIVHEEMRSAGFMVEPQNYGRWVVSGLSRFGLQIGGDGFSLFGRKTDGFGFPSLGLKTGSYSLVIWA
jgi:hypothetical protein